MEYTDRMFQMAVGCPSLSLDDLLCYRFKLMIKSREMCKFYSNRAFKTKRKMVRNRLYQTAKFKF